MSFSEAAPGLFRDNKGIVYVKLEEPKEDANAIAVTSGKARKFEETEEIMEW